VFRQKIDDEFKKFSEQTEREHAAAVEAHRLETERLLEQSKTRWRSHGMPRAQSGREY